MSRVPGLFGRNPRAAPQPSRQTEAPKSKPIDKGKAVIIEDTPPSPPKKRAAPTQGQDARHKRPKVTDPMAGEFFSKAAPLIKDVLVRNWESREEDVAHEAMVRASSELLFHSLKERAIVHKYRELLGAAEEKEKKYLQEMVALRKQLTDLQAAYATDVQAVEKANQALELQLEKQGVILEENTSKLKGMAVEIDKLWVKEHHHAEELKAAEDNGFEEGFRSYLKGFLAVKPDFDWSDFGADIVQWMADFKVAEAEAISEKRAEHLAKLASEARPEKESNSAPAPSPVREEQNQSETVAKDPSPAKSQEPPAEA